MRWIALAADYDGTLATGGIVASETVAALRRLRASGRRFVLITGRQLDDLLALFPHTDLVDRIVAENGSVMYRPDNGSVTLVGEPPPEAFITALRARGVTPLSVGRVIVATDDPFELMVRDTIRELGLDRDVIRNKGAVMVLPAGIDKGSGLRRALSELALSSRDTVGVGDAENDQAFLDLCGCAVAVAGALPIVKARVTWVTKADAGRGVVEVIERMLKE